MTVRNFQELAASKSPLMAQAGEGGLELGKVFGVLRRRLPLIAGITTVFVALALLKVLTEKPIYQSRFEILTGSVTIETEVLSSLPETLSSNQQRERASTLDTTKIRVLLSPNVLEPVLTELRKTYPKVGYGALISGLNIKIDNENILQVTYRHSDPQFVKTVVDLLLKAYLNYSLEDRQKDIRQGINFVEAQLPKLEEQVSGLQGQLQRFRQRYNLIDPQVQAEQLSEQRGSLIQELLTTQTQLKESRLLYQELKTALDQQPLEMANPSPLVNSPRYQKILDQLLEVDSQLAEDSTLYLQGSPELDVLQEQRRNLVPLLQQEGRRVEQQVISQIQELDNRQQALSESLETLNQQIKQLSSITREYNEIQQQLQISTDNLSQFLAKREGLRIDAAQRQSPWQLLTAPSDPTPSSTSLRRTIVLGAILGLLLGIGIALIVDQLSSLIHTAKEIKQITKLPVLGVIPNQKNLNEDENIFVSETDSQGVPLNQTLDEHYRMIPSEFLESFRSLYVNIRLVSPDVSLRCLAVSSAIPDSGKTTVALYLAWIAATMGQKVLLIDTDLRRPNLHHRLQMSGDVGLTDVITSTATFDQAIQKVAWEPNLFFMAAGPIPPDPTRILASASMKQMIEQGNKEFDLVIYDTPPVLGFADTYLLASQLDGLLLVTRLHQIKRSTLEQVVEELSMASSPLLGVVVNDSHEKSSSVYTYYQPQKEY